MNDKEKYRLTLQALPSNVPAINRLRSALKSLLRTFGLRCLVVEDLTEKPNDAAKPKN